MWILLTSGKLINTDHLTQVQRDRDTNGNIQEDRIIVRWDNGNTFYYSGEDAREIYNTVVNDAEEGAEDD